MSQHPRRHADYPVGIPVAPPPNWRGGAAPVAPRSPFQRDLALVLQGGLVAVLVMVCVGIGWLLVQGGRRERQAQRAKAPPTRVAAARPIPEERVPRPEEKEEVARPDPRAKLPDPAPPERPAPPPPAPIPPAGVVLTYEKDVLPIVQRACLSCHSARKKRGGLSLHTYAALQRGGDNGLAVKAGNPDDSPLYASIVSGQMPPSGKKLSAADVKIIRDWIAGGARAGVARPRASF